MYSPIMPNTVATNTINPAKKTNPTVSPIINELSVPLPPSPPPPLGATTKYKRNWNTTKKKKKKKMMNWKGLRVEEGNTYLWAIFQNQGHTHKGWSWQERWTERFEQWSSSQSVGPGWIWLLHQYQQTAACWQGPECSLWWIRDGLCWALPLRSWILFCSTRARSDMWIIPTPDEHL